jgi:HKD family nuclease
MKINFIGQGIHEENSVGQRLLGSLSNGLFHKFIAISAFASESAVLGINELLLKANLESITFYVGIDQKGTSKEALEAFLKIENAEVSIIHTTSGIIFHPKIYIFEGLTKTIIIVGSSNLTIQGLFRNIEASLLIEFDNLDEKGLKILSDIYNFIETLSENKSNLNQELIEKLYESKVIPLESENKETRGKINETDKEIRNPLSWEQVKSVFPSIKINRIPNQFKVKRNPRNTNNLDSQEEILDDLLDFDIEKGELVWQKHNLPSSDAQQVKGDTKITGALRLGQAEYRVAGKLIDKNTYFRQDIFGELNWVDAPRTYNTPIQETIAEFDIIIDNEYFGVFSLRISHDEGRISNQANITTIIHWGTEAIKILKENNVIGKRLSLYKPIEDGKPFTIEIL